ncbi:glycosyltransferase family 1 protein [bacterium]|nr:glycosyltransferase family 1 protein [bacterium]
MKILVLANYAESFIEFRGHLVQSLATEGHEVTVCLPVATERLEHFLRQAGVNLRLVRLERTGLNPLTDIKTLMGYVSLFRELSPDAVLNYTIKPVIYGSLAGRLAGVQNVCSVITGLGYVFIGDTPRHRILRRVVVLLYRLALVRNRTIFFLNADDRRLLSSLGILATDQQSVVLNGEGIDPQFYCETQPLTERPAFLLIGRLLRDKGIYEYVEAARLLRQRYPQATFRVLGPFDSNPSAIKRDHLFCWVEDGIIEYLGETDDVRPAIAASSVYVLPSYREGTPRTVLEAMAMGRPVVTTDAPGCRETVRDGDNGFLVPVGDSEALAKAMERFILQPELICRMGRRSREIAVEKYDVHKVNAVIIEAMGLADEKSI